MSYAIDAVPAEQIVKTHITDGPNLDAFSRLRTSNIDTVFDSSFQYDLQPLIYQSGGYIGPGEAVTIEFGEGQTLVRNFSLSGTAGDTVFMTIGVNRHYFPGDQ